LNRLGNLGAFLKQNYDKVLLGIMLILMAVGLWYASNVVKTARGIIKENEEKVGDSVPDAMVQDIDKAVFNAVVKYEEDREYDYLIGKTWKPGTDKPNPDSRRRPWLPAFEEQVATNLPLIPAEFQTSDLSIVSRSMVDPTLIVYTKEQSKHLVHADTIENPFTGQIQRCDVDRWILWLGKKDSDEDGIPDAKEKEAGLDPNSYRDAECDVDGDGFSNLDEYEWDDTGAAIGDPAVHPPSVKRLRFIRTQTERLRVILKGINMNNAPTNNRAWQMHLQVYNSQRRRMADVFARLGGQIPGTRFRITNAEYRENRQGPAGGVEKSEIQIQEGQNDPITLQLDQAPRTNRILRVQLIHLATRQQSVAVLNSPVVLKTPSGSEESYIITQDETGARIFANIDDQKIEIKKVDRTEFDSFPSRFAHCNGAAADPGLPPGGDPAIPPPR
jgi:hypothetical protein